LTGPFGENMNKKMEFYKSMNVFEIDERKLNLSYSTILSLNSEVKENPKLCR
jgi:hypothetical protein